ncbi:MAG: beta-hydroxyacyl-ACP dehydratase [Planctomycetes bacterium]|nr:beta-hydroxyacyl-ACP dehydratase [Planctomycetota bacterium]
MRWFWIDRFLEFESGRRAVAVKNVSYAEEQIPEYAFSMPVMPGSLIIEGLAQTGGLLVGEHNGFRERVVLAKLGKVIFHDYATPGDQLIYTTEIQDVKSSGAIVNATAHVQDQLIVDAEIVFAHLDDRFAGVELFDPGMFVGILRSYRLYEVGKRSDGSPLEVPAHLLEAERRTCSDPPWEP